MSLMNWSEAFDTGVHEMNDQHKVLLKIMNDLYDLVENKALFPETLSKLDELKSYTIQHFKEEEAYMESIAFPGLASHKLIHKSLLEKFTEHHQKFCENKEFHEDFFSFLKLWLQSHIMGIDVKYGEHQAKMAG